MPRTPLDIRSRHGREMHRRCGRVVSGGGEEAGESVGRSGCVRARIVDGPLSLYAPGEETVGQKCLFGSWRRGFGCRINRTRRGQESWPGGVR